MPNCSWLLAAVLSSYFCLVTGKSCQDSWFDVHAAVVGHANDWLGRSRMALDLASQFASSSLLSSGGIEKNASEAGQKCVAVVHILSPVTVMHSILFVFSANNYFQRQFRYA